MRIVNRQSWGFTLEHNGNIIILPLLPSGGILISHHKVMFSESHGAIIKSGDYPFYIDNDGESHIIMHDDKLAELIMECMVDWVRSQQ